MNVDDPGQWVFCICAALNGDAQGRLGLLDGDAEVALMIGNYEGGVLLSPLGNRVPGLPLGVVQTPGHPGPVASLVQQLLVLHHGQSDV